MYDDMRNRLKDASEKMPDTAKLSVEKTLRSLSLGHDRKEKNKSLFIKFAVAASVVILVVGFILTPVGKSAAASLIEWIKGAVFIHGDKSTIPFANIDEGEYSYTSTAELISETNAKILCRDDMPCEISLVRTKDVIRITYDYGDIELYQHQTLDNSEIPYTHAIYTDYENGEEEVQVTVCGIEFAGYASYKESLILGNREGVWYEISAKNTDVESFLSFVHGLEMRGGES